MRCKAGSSSTRRTHTWRSPLLRKLGSLNDVAPMPPAPTLIRPRAKPLAPVGIIASFLRAPCCPKVVPPQPAKSPTPHARADLDPITPIPAIPARDQRRLVLGERLFGDPRLSHDDTRSCSSCHDIRTNGASANAQDLTPGGLPFALNTPTVFNA